VTIDSKNIHPCSVHLMRRSRFFYALRLRASTARGKANVGLDMIDNLPGVTLFGWFLGVLQSYLKLLFIFYDLEAKQFLESSL